MGHESCATDRGQEKKNACPHTFVLAVPAFIYERRYPIDHEMLFDNKTAVVSSCSVDGAIRDTLHFIQMW